MNIVICDNDQTYRDKLELIINGILINKGFNSEIVLSTDNPHDVLSYIKTDDRITLYFLDIDVKNPISGIDIAAFIRKKDEISPIAVVTNDPDSIALTYEYKLKIFDFIEKGQIEKHEQRIKECIMLAEQRQLDGYENCINIHNYGRSFSVPFDHIYFIDTIPGSHKMTIHSPANRYEFYGKVKDVVKDVDNRFFKCHKSVVVNKHKIIGVDKRKKSILLFDGYTCPYSPKYFNPDTIIDANQQYISY